MMPCALADLRVDFLYNLDLLEQFGVVKVSEVTDI